jgi:hypothetical protein
MFCSVCACVCVCRWTALSLNVHPGFADFHNKWKLEIYYQVCRCYICAICAWWFDVFVPFDSCACKKSRVGWSAAASSRGCTDSCPPKPSRPHTHRHRHRRRRKRRPPLVWPRPRASRRHQRMAPSPPRWYPLTLSRRTRSSRQWRSRPSLRRSRSARPCVRSWWPPVGSSRPWSRQSPRRPPSACTVRYGEAFSYFIRCCLLMI